MRNRAIAVVGGQVFDSRRSTFEPGVVLIEEKKIVAVGSPQQVPAPEGAEIIPAEGKYVLPGLIEGHNHLYLIPGPFEAQSVEPERTLLQRAIRNGRKQLRDGVTTMRDSGTPHFLDLYFKQLIDEDLIPGPHLMVSGPWITASHGHGSFPGATIADGTEEIRKAVRMTLKQGVDFVKVFVSGGTASRLSGPKSCYYTLEELRALCEESHMQGRQVSAHLHGGPGVRFCIEAGVDTIEHGSAITDDAEIELIAAKGIAWMFNQGARVADPNPNLPQFERDKLLASRQTSILAYQKARKAGVKILAGADGYHDDHAYVWALEALCKSGATPREALEAATRTASEVFGIADERGSLQPGRFADVLIVGSDPLQNISALRDAQLVMKEGKVYRDL